MLTIGLGIAAALTTLAIRRLWHASQTVDRILAEELPPAEPRDAHAPSCEIWRGNGPCTCGA